MTMGIFFKELNVPKILESGLLKFGMKLRWVKRSF